MSNNNTSPSPNTNHTHSNKNTFVNVDKNQKVMNGVALWCSYYRANPHRFAKDYLGIELKLFQKILLYMMNQCTYFMYLASRGQGKTFLIAVFCCVRCILYPETKICIASKARRQANEVLQKIEGEILQNSPNLKLELKDKPIITASEGLITFKNGSRIRVVTSSDSSRGARANILIVDEFRLVEESVINTILRRFLSSPRFPRYLGKPEYQDPKYIERNKEFYLSSAWLKSHWSWEKVKAYCAALVDDTKDYFLCGLPYQLPIKEGLLDANQVADEMSEANFNAMSWDIEMGCIFWGESEDAFFKYEDLIAARRIETPFYPWRTRTLVGDKLAKLPDKVAGEVRVVCADVAVISSKKHKNDATILYLMQLLPRSDGQYIRNILYSEVYEGGHTETQALAIRRLYADMNCDYIVIDRGGAGIGIVDNLMKDMIDEETGETYSAFTCMNDEEIASRYKGSSPNPPKVIYAVVGSPKFNSECAFSLRDCIKRGKTRLLMTEQAFEEKMRSSRLYNELSPEQKMDLRMPFVQTTLIITELVLLEYTTIGSEVRIKEQGTNRKDRYSALAYGNQFANELERKKRKIKVNNNKLVFNMRAPKIRSH